MPGLSIHLAEFSDCDTELAARADIQPSFVLDSPSHPEWRLSLPHRHIELEYPYRTGPQVGRLLSIFLLLLLG